LATVFPLTLSINTGIDFLKLTLVCYYAIKGIAGDPPAIKPFLLTFNQEIIMPVTRPIIYTVSTCPACLKLKEDWKGKGIQFRERQVDKNQVWLNEALRYGDMVPIIVYGDGQVEVGYAGMIG
jgi:glutaredoxin